MSPTQETLLARETTYLDQRTQIARALRDCGLDEWLISEQQDCPHLVYLTSSNTPGTWWFRPGWDIQPFQLLLPFGAALRVINEYALERLDQGAHPDLFATEDDANELWERLRNLAESLASGGVA